MKKMTGHCDFWKDSLGERAKRFSLGSPRKTPFILGLDLDGVVADYPRGMAVEVAKHFDVPVDSIPQMSDYSLVKSGWGFADEDEYRRVHGNAVETGLYTRLPVMEGAVDALWKMSEAGIHIRVITSRFVNHGQNAKVVAQTAQWLDESHIPYRDLTFVRDKRDVNADLYIDDSPSNVTSLRSAGRNVMIFDQPYNQALNGLRVKTWDDVLRHFNLADNLVSA